MGKAYNKVLQSVATGTAVHGGKVRSIEIATRTTNWQRPSDIAKQEHSAFKRALEAYPGKLPKGTETLVVRELAHESISDNASHYTAGAVDKNGNWLESVHIDAEEEPKADKKKKDSK